MPELILLSVIVLLVAMLFINAYFYDKTLEDIEAPLTQMEKEIRQLKETIALAKINALLKDKKNEIPDDSKRDN